jgi:hypothetical protein
MLKPFAAVGIVSIAAVVLPSNAQSVESVVVAKVRFHRQTDASGPVLLEAAEFPFGFDANVQGTDLDLLDPPTVTGPFANPEPGHNGGMLGLNEDEWRYGAPDFLGWGTETQAELDALFGTGTYTFTLSGQTVQVLLGAPAFPDEAATLTISGGAWENGVYRIDAGSDLTVQTPGFAEFGVAGVESASSLGVFSENFGDEVFALGSDGGTGALSLTIPADTLTPGSAYIIEAFRTIATDFRPLGFGDPDAIVAGVYEVITETVLIVNPDNPCPADIAEPFGVLDLADIVAFVSAFTVQDPVADFDGNGVFDLADITGFVSSFVAGCP